MAYPVLISLANIDANICSKTLLHGYFLLALLPIPKNVHKDSCVCGLLKKQLFHQALNHILAPLKTAATIGVIMSNPGGNLQYCYTLLASWITDTQEECLIAGMGPMASLVTTAIFKHFSNPFCHSTHTSQTTLLAIWTTCAEHDPSDYKNFLQVVRCLSLNSVIDPVWIDWLLSKPCEFITPEALHHFYQFLALL